MRLIAVVFALGLLFTNFGCQARSNANVKPAESGESGGVTVKNYGFDIVNTWPHDADAYTQGLVFHEGKLLESTGREGKSSLRSVELETGKVLKKIDVPVPFFAEGITLLQGKIYQLTWRQGRGFIYDSGTFEKLGEFSYLGEGWGLTNDGSSLILSDGSNRLRFVDPNNFQVKKTIAVSDRRIPINNLNELEYIQGEIYANIWHEERIVRIDPQTGEIRGWINLTGLKARSEVNGTEAVLNGIAYDEKSDRLFVTGKLWPKLYEVRLKPQ